MLLFTKRSAFTLIELLVVIAIVAVLATVVVLVLNPAELLRQSRDANRLSDMANLNNAIALYSTDLAASSSYSLGTAGTSYLSLPDSSSACANLGLVLSSYAYACSPSSTYRSASQGGWLPINFSGISSGAPFGSLAVDPVNQTSSNLYYSYVTGGGRYELFSFMESQKYGQTMKNSGGIDPAIYEIGTGVMTLPETGRGLLAYWPLNEGANSTAVDWSANASSGAWSGTQAGTNGYYTAASKAGSYAGYFNGSDDKVLVPTSTVYNSTSVAVFAWVNLLSIPNTWNAIVDHGEAYSFGNWSISTVSNTAAFAIGVFDGSSKHEVLSPSVATGTWNLIGLSYDGSKVTCYLNGASCGTSAGGMAVVTAPIGIGDRYTPAAPYYVSAAIGDVRIYGRAVSAAEAQEIYNAEK